MSFDDLPRSPTGRVPQWVIDEAQGRVASPSPWRGDAYDTSADAVGERLGARRSADARDRRDADGYAPTGTRRRRARRSGSSVTVAVLCVLITGGFVGVWLSQLPEVSWDAVVAALSAKPVRTTNLDATGAVQPFEPPSGFEGRPPRGLEESPWPRGVPTPVDWDGSPYAFQDTQRRPDGLDVPVTFSPCRPVHYVVNTSGAPVGFVDDVAGVMRELTAATGFVFVDDGTTTESGGADRALYQPDRYGERWAPLLIQFSDEDHFARLEGDVAGVGANRVVDDGDGLRVVVTGTVWLDTDLLERQPVGAEPVHVAVLRHELAHVLGLDHVDDATQLMNPTQMGDVTTFQSGDLYGLSLLNRGVCAPDV